MKRFITVTITLLTLSTGAWATVNWESDYDAALLKAKNEQKLVMVDVYTDWCGWCKRLDKDTYGNKDVETKLGKDFIAVKINPEKSAKGAGLAKQFGTRGYPHIVFLDATGKKLSESPGYMPADKFLKRLDELTERAKKK